MTTELHERLAGLASVTPATSPPPDLWPRGVRRRRVVAAGRTAVVAVLVLMVGLGGWAWHQTRPVEPADTHGTPHLPDGFYTPSPWLPSFDGPPGPLVAESDGVSYELVSVDIRSGAVTSLVQRARGAHGADPGGLSLATGLLSAPRAAAAEPGRPWDLRWAAGIIALCLVGCGLVTWGATRGRRA